MNFVNLHQHTTFSTMDSVAKISDLAKRAKELKYPAIALTDHGTLSGAVEFYKTMKAIDIKPILGMEAYVANRSRFDKENKIDHYYHLTLIAMNKKGWQNLCTLVNESFKAESFYRKPRIDRELLRRHNEGLIALSGCLASNLSKAIMDQRNISFKDEDGYETLTAIECADCSDGHICDKHRKESPEDVIKWHKEIFGDRFYLELMNHGLRQENIIREALLEFAEKHKIKTVATGDTHMVLNQDVIIHDMMLADRKKTTLDDPDFGKYPGDGYYLPDEEYLKQRFSQYPEAINNTLEIADRVNFEFEFGNYKIPTFGNIRQEDELFRKQAIQGLIKRMGTNKVPTEYKNRLLHEIQIITQMNFASYFLIVSDYVVWAKTHGILVGPGRGSAAGSLVSYALRITDIDPIQHDLSFGRFLNKGRSAIPLISFPEYPFEQWMKHRGTHG